MRTLKLTTSYDGTAYAGWQRQKQAATIQATLEAALAEVEGRPVTVHGAGRTDAGVHALGQVASCTLAHAIDPPTLVRALNAKLPPDIRVLRVEEASADFHARRAATRKCYRYRIDGGPVADPMERRYAWHVAEPLDLEAMGAAGAALVGRHDFAAFETRAAESDVVFTTRTIRALEVRPDKEPVILVEVVGDGFLRYMVRTIVGTLVQVGTGRRSVDDMTAILESGRRASAGPTAPAHGLFLVRVDYDR